MLATNLPPFLELAGTRQIGGSVCLVVNYLCSSAGRADASFGTRTQARERPLTTSHGKPEPPIPFRNVHFPVWVLVPDFLNALPLNLGVLGCKFFQPCLVLVQLSSEQPGCLENALQFKNRI